MKKIISLIGIFLLLSSCSNPEDIEKISDLQTKVTQLENKISLLESEKKDDLFEKNLQCGLLTDEIKEELFDPQYVFDTLDPQIEEIFYSHRTNSCLYIFSHQKIQCENINIDSNLYKEMNCLGQDKILVDFNSKKYLAQDSTYTDGIIEKCEKNNDYLECFELHGFDSKVQSYKN